MMKAAECWNNQSLWKVGRGFTGKVELGGFHLCKTDAVLKEDTAKKRKVNDK